MKCRHCGNELTLPFIDLGAAPPSNAYLTLADLSAPEKWYPLRVLVCTECWLVQTDDYASRADLFSDDYAYFSSFSTSWLQHAEQYMISATQRFGLGSDSMVVEVASNDGYLLQYFKNGGVPCLGIEPTISTARAARNRGIAVVEEFFGSVLASRLAAEGKHANLMVANNVLAHVPDINDFVAGFALLLKPAGIATFEFPHLMKLVQENQFDTIYHEHFSYLSLTAVHRIFERNGLNIFDVEELPTHGGSLRIYAQRTDSGTYNVNERVSRLKAKEFDAGITKKTFYQDFQAKVERLKDDLVAFLINAKRQGKIVAAYGAAAKGNTLMNYAGIRADLIAFVMDRNPAKQGKFMPGSRIPIVSESQMAIARPDFVLLLPWNIKTELLQQLNYIGEWGGRIVTAVPCLNIE